MLLSQLHESIIFRFYHIPTQPKYHHHQRHPRIPYVSSLPDISASFTFSAGPAVVALLCIIIRILHSVSEPNVPHPLLPSALIRAINRATPYIHTSFLFDDHPDPLLFDSICTRFTLKTKSQFTDHLSYTSRSLTCGTLIKLDNPFSLDLINRLPASSSYLCTAAETLPPSSILAVRRKVLAYVSSLE